MDLSMLLTDNEAVELQLTNPKNNEPLTTESGEPISLMVVGTDNDIFIQADHLIVNRRLKKAALSRKVSFTAEDMESERLQRAVACVVGFKNITLGGENLEYSKANTEKLLRTIPAVREQVEEFAVERSNFLKQASLS